MKYKTCFAVAGLAMLAALPAGAAAQVQAGSGASASDQRSADAEEAYVYATVYSDHIKPQLIMNALNGETSGQWIATQTEDELNQIYYNYGRYGLTSGSFKGSFAGNTFTADYIADFWNDGLQGACPTKKDGTFYWGQLILEFSADRKSFQAKKAPCDSDPSDAYFEWSGTLTGRTAAVVPTSGTDGALARGGNRQASGEPRSPNAAERIAQQAGDEVEQAVGEAVRRKVRKGLGSLLGND